MGASKSHTFDIKVIDTNDKSIAGKFKVKDINARILIKSVSRLAEMVVKVLAE
jgi:hypothetical protein